MTQSNTKNEEQYEALTKLSDKNKSPLVIRKYTRPGFPLFVALITDDDVADLDDFMKDYIEPPNYSSSNLQELRNMIGNISEFLVQHYRKAEGVAVIAFADKCVISSLFGDFMTHMMCRYELYSLLGVTTGV